LIAALLLLALSNCHAAGADQLKEKLLTLTSSSSNSILVCCRLFLLLALLQAPTS
jgi:hypothetical protein